MEILNLYVSLLNAGHMTADEEGVIYRQLKGLEEKKTPVRVTLPNAEKAVMVMPIKKQTSNPDWSNRVVFHPLRENTQRGESLVMERYRTTMFDRVNASALVLMVSILRLASDPVLQTGLTPDQLSYLAQLPDADAKALKNFNELTIKLAVSDKPLWAFIKASGIKDAVVYRRLCSVRSPMLEAIENAADRKVKGTMLRVSDVALFRTLFGLVFPQSSGVNFDYYCQGSNSVRAPTLDAFMKSVKLMAENINDLAMMFDSAVPNLADNIMFDMGWTEIFEDIDAYSPKILMIPPMPGNEGRVLNERAESGKEPALPWEPADAPPSGMAGKEDYRTVGTVVNAPQTRNNDGRTSTPSYTGGYGNQRNSTPAPAKKPASDDDFQKSAFYLMREREKQQQSDYRGNQGYGSRRSTDDPAVGNGYAPQNSYGGRPERDRRSGDSRYDDRRDQRNDRRGY